MSSLLDLTLSERYRSDSNGILHEFYIPCFANSKRYFRGVGFFSAASLLLAINGVAGFVRNGGKMRLVVSPVLDEHDSATIAAAYEERESIACSALVRELERELPVSVKTDLGIVSWLIINGFLEIKVAITSNDLVFGMYHEKIGIFEDELGNSVAFTGSANETVHGLIGNFERIDVFRSWNDADTTRLPLLKSDCENLWSNQTAGLAVFEFPDAVKEALLRAAPPRPPGSVPASEDRSSAFSIVKAELKARQLEAVVRWDRAGGKGILAMATGSGKTIAALGCAAVVSKLSVLMIAVPTLELAAQWVSVLREFTDLPSPIEAFGESRLWTEKFFRKLCILNDGKAYSEKDVLVVIGTYSSLSDEKVSRLIADAAGLPSSSLIICDEAHNAGAAAYQKVLRSEFRYRLGLSATPIRKYDDAGSQAILDYFSGIVYEFNIGEAIAAEILSPYDYLIKPVYLTIEEYEEYKELSRRIASLSAQGTSVDEEMAKRLKIKRSAVLKGASGKHEALKTFIEKAPIKRALVYAADIEDASTYANILAQKGVRAARYSSLDKERRRILNEFAQERLDALISINCLDEGVDIPAAQMAILGASDGSERQFIQRRGRVLRSAPKKLFATIVDFVVLPPEFESNVQPFANEIRRIAEFASFARNRDSVAADLARLLENYGYSYSRTLVELGR